MAQHVTVCEVGPRDGLQMAKTRMPTAVKIRWIEAIAGAGVPEIEVGSFVPPRLIPSMADTGEVVHALRGLPALIVALAPNLKGAQMAAAAGAQRITIPVSVSEGHSRANTNRGTMDQVAEVARIAEWLRAEHPSLELEAACSTAFGCSIDGVVPERRVVEVAAALAEAGARMIALADTVGYGHPAQIRSVVRAVRAEVGDALERPAPARYDGPGAGECAGRAGRGHHQLRRGAGGAGRLSLRAGRQWQHRHRRPGFSCWKAWVFIRGSTWSGWWRRAPSCRRACRPSRGTAPWPAPASPERSFQRAAWLPECRLRWPGSGWWSSPIW